MRSFLLLTVVLFSVSLQAQNKTVRFDGLYVTDPKIDSGGDTTYHYLRFYPQKQVITVTSPGTPDNVKTWFNLKTKGTSKGKYSINKSKLTFSSTLGDVTVDYNGTIASKNELSLYSKSRKNGFDTTRTFHFVPVKKW